MATRAKFTVTVNLFKVRLFVKGKNVTDKVLSTGKLFKDIPDGESTRKLRIKVKGKADVGPSDAVGIDASGYLDGHADDSGDIVFAGAGVP